jgi:hypothetical protein
MGGKRGRFPAKDRGMRALKTIGAILIPLAGLLFFLALMARIDSHEELIHIRVMDVVIGLMLAVSFALAREPKPVRRRVTVAVAFVTWLLASGLLLLWHEFQVYARTNAAEYGITRGRIVQTHEALTTYSKDCGEFPSATLGLNALRENPGLAKWKGPYTPDERSICDSWGRRLRYRLHGNRPVVWSCGKDGISGTRDDITVNEGGDAIQSHEKSN